MTLRGLIEAVERGDSRSDIAYAAIGNGGGWEPPTIGGIRADQWQNALDAHDGSIDAAKRMHDALLPGWDWCSATDAHKEQWFSVGEPHGDYETEETYAENPARAWLLAILRALEGEP